MAMPNRVEIEIKVKIRKPCQFQIRIMREGLKTTHLSKMEVLVMNKIMIGIQLEDRVMVVVSKNLAVDLMMVGVVKFKMAHVNSVEEVLEANQLEMEVVTVLAA